MSGADSERKVINYMLVSAYTVLLKGIDAIFQTA